MIWSNDIACLRGCQPSVNLWTVHKKTIGI